VNDCNAVQMRRMNIFGKSTAAVTPEEEAAQIRLAEEEAAAKAREIFELISPEAFEELSMPDKRTYLDMLELRGLPRTDRHLYWEKRTDTYTAYPLPEHPAKKSEDIETASFSGDSYSSYSSASTATKSASPEGASKFRLTRRNNRVELKDTDEIKLLHHIQAQKRKKFIEQSIISAHGVRVLPTYLKRPSSPPQFHSIEEQINEEREIYNQPPIPLSPKSNYYGGNFGGHNMSMNTIQESLGDSASNSCSTPPRKKRVDYLDNDDYSIESIN
jgi:hypothetical protein